MRPSVLTLDMGCYLFVFTFVRVRVTMFFNGTVF